MGGGTVNSIGSTIPFSHTAGFVVGLKGVVDLGDWFGSQIGVLEVLAGVGW